MGAERGTSEGTKAFSEEQKPRGGQAGGWRAWEKLRFRPVGTLILQKDFPQDSWVLIPSPKPLPAPASQDSASCPH